MGILERFKRKLARSANGVRQLEGPPTPVALTILDVVQAADECEWELQSHVYFSETDERLLIVPVRQFFESSEVETIGSSEAEEVIGQRICAALLASRDMEFAPPLSPWPTLKVSKARSESEFWSRYRRVCFKTISGGVSVKAEPFRPPDIYVGAVVTRSADAAPLAEVLFDLKKQAMILERAYFAE